MDTGKDKSPTGSRFLSEEARYRKGKIKTVAYEVVDPYHPTTKLLSRCSNGVAALH